MNTLELPGGEPRFTKIEGENRYYDHALGKSISHRKYWDMRKAAKGQPKRSAGTFTPEKAAQLKKAAPTIAPPTIQANAAPPSELAKHLLAQSEMYGSPVVQTPDAPALKDLATDLSEDVNKSVESLAATVSPALAGLVVAAFVLMLPGHLSWLAPDQDEAELILEPAARIVMRFVGLTGGDMSPTGKDILAIVLGVGAYAAGAKTRMDEYLENVRPYEQPQAQQQPQASTRTSAGNGDSRVRRADSLPVSPLANVAGNEPIAFAQALGRNTQQAKQDTGEQASARHANGLRAMATQKQLQEAASVRSLFEQDYAGRLRLGLG